MICVKARWRKYGIDIIRDVTYGRSLIAVHVHTFEPESFLSFLSLVGDPTSSGVKWTTGIFVGSS